MSELAGTPALVRLALRRDRVLLPVWLAVFVVSAASSAAATVGLYPTLQERVQAAEGINLSTALVALYGRIYDPTSEGAIAMIKMSGLGTALVAVLAIFLVVRHTRGEEEAGRLELIGATVVGRRAPLTAALVVAAGTSVVLGLLTALALVATGLPAGGALAFGTAWASAGIAFAAVAAVTAQLATGARAAVALAGTVLAATYLVRAVGDSSETGGLAWVTWLSPIGWTQQIRPFAGDRWPVLLVLLVFTAALLTLAYALVAGRDLGGGLLADRAGPAGAATLLRTPEALAWRLQTPLLAVWVAGYAVLGVVLGGIAASIGDLLDSPRAVDFIQSLGGVKAMTDAYLAAEMGFVGVFTSVFAVQAVLRLHGEEAGLRAEPLLATAVPRPRWAGSHLGVALGGGVVLLTTMGLAAGTAHAVTTGDAGQVARLVGAALVQLPVVALFAGFALALFGLSPRATWVAWAALVGSLLLGEIGPVLGLDQWVLDLSSFAHVPRLPGSPLDVMPLAVLSLLAVLATGTGLAGIRRRDVGT